MLIFPQDDFKLTQLFFFFSPARLLFSQNLNLIGKTNAMAMSCLAPTKSLLSFCRQNILITRVDLNSDCIPPPCALLFVLPIICSVIDPAEGRQPSHQNCSSRLTAHKSITAGGPSAAKISLSGQTRGECGDWHFVITTIHLHPIVNITKNQQNHQSSQKLDENAPCIQVLIGVSLSTIWV